MDNRLRNNLLACLFVLVMLTAMVFLAGCAGQGVKLDVQTSNDKCGTKNVTFSTDYQVEQLEIGRTIEGGGEGDGGSEGCGGGYTVSLGKGTTKDAEFGIISELVQALLGAYGIPVAGQAEIHPTSRIQGMDAPRPMEEVFEAGIEVGRRQQTQQFNGGISSRQFKVDGAGNVWIDGRVNPTLPLKPDGQ